MATRASTSETLAIKLLKDCIREVGVRYAVFVGAILLFASLSLLPAQLLRFFTENLYVIDGARVSELVSRLMLYGALVALALWISRLGSILCQEWLRVTIEARLRTRILRTLHNTALAELEASQRGEWYSRITGDLGRVELFLTDAVPAQIRMSAILLGAGALFFFHTGPLALIPIAAALLLAGGNFAFQRRLAPRLREVRELHAGVFQLLIENFEGIRTLRSQGAEPFMKERFQGKVQYLSSQSMKVVRAIGTLLGGNEFFSQVLITICLTGVTVFISRGEIGLHEALLYPFYIGMFFNAAQDLSRSAYDWNRFLVEGGRLAEFLEAPPKPSLPTIPEPPEARDEVLLTGVQVGHPGKPALTPPFDFRLRRRELCLVMGPSGSGKSTFLEILAGLRPAYDGVTHLSRSLFAYVEQRPYIFEGTIRENLCLGSTGYDARSLWRALEKASLKDFVLAVGGLDFPLRDRGTNLSEGERYRLALTRAFLLERPFLLLDEPFASIDSASINVVVRALNEEKHRAGILVVSHQVPPALEMDWALHFDEIGQKNFGDETVFVPQGAVRIGLPA